MNEQNKYLDSGLLEDFCLGLLPEKEAAEIIQAAKKYPAVQERIEAIESCLKAAYELSPANKLKQQTFQLFDNAGKEELIDLENPPFIDKYSDVANWNKAVAAIVPSGDFGDIKVHPILQTAQAEMYVAWVQHSLEEEGHDEHNFTESFLILEGSCECDLGGKIIQLRAGDFLEIPFKTKHTIRSTSSHLGYVKAVLQRRKIA